MPTATWCERLSPVDAMFLQLEDGAAHMHMGGVFVCEGPPPAQPELLAHLAGRLDRVPRYRQRLSTVPLGLGRPAWVDDAGLDLAHHVRRVVADAPGTEALEALAARRFGEPLDRSRPLWAIDVVEDLGGERFALVSRTHHSLVDGMGSCDIVAAITDGAPALPDPPGLAPPPRWAPQAEPPAAARLGRALREQAGRGLGLLRDVARPGSEGRRVLADVARGLAPLAALGLQGRAPPSPFNAPIGPRRRYAMASLPLAAVKGLRPATGGTVNDVLLSVVAGALRALLQRRGAAPDAPLRAFIPVSVRSPSAPEGAGNHVSAVYCALPVDEADPLRRVRRVSAAMARVKARGEAAGVLLVRHAGELALPAVSALAMRLELAYRRFNLVVSNTRGPEAPRYLLGRRILSFHPAIPLAPNNTLSVGLLSYAGTIGIGLLGDAEAAPDVAQLARDLDASFAALLARAGGGVALARGAA